VQGLDQGAQFGRFFQVGLDAHHDCLVRLLDVLVVLGLGLFEPFDQDTLDVVE
jgi:hypothetical protein